MASEQIINSVIDNKSNCVTSEQTENPTSGSAIPETEHQGEAETHAALPEIAAEGQGPEGWAAGAGLGESGGEQAAREGQESQKKNREEEEKERTDREFSETIEKLDSVLLEAGGKEGQIEGDGTDISRTEEGNGTEQTTESGGETTVQAPAEETTVQVSGGETIAQVSGGETTVQAPAEETTVQAPGGETTVQVSGGETTVQAPAEETTVQVSGGETTVQAPAEETTVQVSGGETAVQAPAEETTVQVSGGETAVQTPAEETTVQVSGGKTTVQVLGEETSAQVPGGETIVQAPTEGTIVQESAGETTVQVPAEEAIVQSSAGETTVQVPAEEAIVQESAGETTVQSSTGETTVQSSAGETTVQEPAEETTAQVSEGETTAQEPAEKTTVQTSGGETTVQVPAEKTTVQTSGGETTVQVPAEVTVGELAVPPMVEGTAQVPSDEATAHVSAEEASVIEAEREATETEGAPSVQVSEETSQEAVLLVTTEEDVSPQPVEGTGTHGTAATQVTKAGEAWIDTLVRDIVTEVTAEGECQAHVSAASSIEQTEEEGGGHSCAGTTTSPDREQVTLEETGAAVPVTHVQAQVSDDITVQEEEEVTGSLGQPGETGKPDQVGLSGTEGVAEEETAAVVEAGRPVKPPGGVVTPDLVTVPSREGTPDPGQPAACWEKEWPPLICTGSEVRADTAEQRGTEQGTVSEKEPRPGAPDMKDWEMIENGVVLAPETPIEREIRLTMERETSLRQQRGIRVTVGEPELVEVRRKTVTVEPAGLPGKERQLAGAQMQREIQLETQREKDLVDQGKVMGTYDRGAQQELQEMKMIFESMNTEPSDPPFKRRQSEMKKSESIEALVEVPVPSNHVAPAAEFKKGPSYAEANGSNIIIIEHASILRRATPSSVYSAAPADLQKTSPAESRRSTPADLRFTRSSSGNAPPPNSESPVAAPGSPFQLLRSPSPRSLLDKEIEEVQQRERELRKQRTSVYGRDSGTSENSQITSHNQRDIQSGVYQPERPNWGKLEVNWPPNKGMTVNGQQDQAWGSPRTRRQRSTLIKSWESGSPNPADDNN